MPRENKTICPLIANKRRKRCPKDCKERIIQHTEAKHTDHVSIQKEMCGSTCNREFACTRPKDHKGHHEAGISVNLIVARWPRGDE
jgi:hypothetical protein